jgi:4'-phosphopantetheinyl transferase
MTLGLSAGSVHVWRADLDCEPAVAEASLSLAELERAARFRFDRDRIRWTRCRAILRELLGAYLGVEPAAIELSAGANGKPRVSCGDGVEFNISHAARVALFALTLDNPVGVDVELPGGLRGPLDAAERVLGPAELQRLRSLPDGSRESEFLRSWVRHEAALKCRGDALGSAAAQDELTVMNLDAGSDAVAAAALERAPDAILQWWLDPRQPQGRPGPLRA